MGPIREMGKAILDAKARDIKPVNISHFITALRTVRPSTQRETIARYEKWNREFGSN